MYIFSESSNESTGKYSPDQRLLLMPKRTRSAAESISTNERSVTWSEDCGKFILKLALWESGNCNFSSSEFKKVVAALCVETEQVGKCNQQTSICSFDTGPLVQWIPHVNVKPP